MAEIIERLTSALAERYAVERELGAGGMATVYLAEDLKHKRKVAVKVLRPELAAVIGAERFLKEIEVTANLQHPHILPLFDSGEADGFLYYVMPFVEGESLRDKLVRERQLDVAEAVAIARDAAGALDYAHRQGVIHRDIKPENILLSEGGAVVADFGIALAVTQAGGNRLTETGLSLGTPTYMSPEQAAGDANVTARSDIYALACVLYEMLAGEPPFTGPNAQSVMAKVVTEPTPSICSVRTSVPREIEEAITKGLAKVPVERFSAAGDLARALELGTAMADRGRLSPGRRRMVISTVTVVVVLLGFLGFRFYRQVADERWVRQVAIPEIERLLGEDSFVEGYHLARDAALIDPEDPTLLGLLEAASTTVSGDTDPSGAKVFYKGYSAADTTWHFVGQAPLEDARFPDAYLRLKLELDGYRTLETAFSPWFGLHATLVHEQADFGDMVSVPSGEWSYSSRVPIAVDRFLLDRYEATNADFQEFIDAGGYRNREYWTEQFVRDGRPVSWEDGISLLKDATGRPGPATWELSRHPAGREHYPVRGVSWYEAVAYCEFAGKSLPTFYHWKRAAGLDIFDDILAFSNFAGDGPVPVGTGGGVGPYGTYDQAGNVKEWTWNASRGGLRHIAGGAWNEPEYMFQDADARAPFAREETHGFRCARYETPPDSLLRASIDLPYFDFNEIEPVDDATFATLAKFYAYDPQPLDARVEAVDSTGPWRREKVSFAAAYGGERVQAHVFVPDDVEPPYQTVVYFPGISAFFAPSSEYLAEWHLLSFIPNSGRALVYPIYKGSYERDYERPPGNVARRQDAIWVTQDLNRVVDYIIDRPDLDHGKLGYMGISYGAEWSIPLAMEPRFTAASLIGGAFDAQWLAGPGAMPETSPWNFVSRILTPAVLINGRYDFQHPYETGQVPFFNALGAPDEHKRFVVLETGHIPPWNDVIRETLDWFDRYLGPVDLSGRDMTPPVR